MKVKDLKLKLAELEKEFGNIDELDIWLEPCGTPSARIEDVGVSKVVSNNSDEHGQPCFSIFFGGDIF